MPAAQPLPDDPIDLAHASWKGQGWAKAADGMAVVTSIMRVQQVLLARVEAILRPLGLTFARYEVLMLLRFSRKGLAACRQDRRTIAGASGERHQRRATIGERRVRDQEDESGRWPQRVGRDHEGGRRVTDEATSQLNDQVFSIVPIPPAEQREVYSVLKGMRRAFGDFS